MTLASPPPRPRPVIAAMAAYRPPLEGRRGAALRLDFNERSGPAPVAAMAALRALAGESVAAYPEYEAYERRLARWLGVAESCVLPTNATDEGIQVVALTFVDPGQKVLLAEPTFAMFRVYAQISGAQVVSVPYVEPDLAFPADLFLHHLATDMDIRVAVLVDPNNPTATDLDSELVARVCATRPDVAVLVDEAYGAFTRRTSIPLIARHANLIVSQTFSKAHGLAGLRIGHLVSCADNIAALRKVRSPYSVNIAAMAAAAALMDQEVEDRDPYVRQCLEGRDLLAAGLRVRGIRVRRAGANFVLADFGAAAAAVGSALRAHGVLVRDRSSDPGLAGHVRITAAPPDDIAGFFEVLDRIAPTWR
ncbi:MAG: aminotransferase class I/II-fold pyridoxal phosphate-dependent enzyme [Candidatus Schekmanbacteria bacterium]|nr:aminotransferase class I/II-fold pyridoxal phosphate-dependent enzyme [Candidatus Schekmanbacteria bacterium]